MNTKSRRGPLLRIPGYAQNAVLQLIVASILGFVMFQAVKVTLEVFGKDAATAAGMTIPMVALPPLHDLAGHWWTPLTYGFAHYSFWNLFSNMLWLYGFGSIVQSLVGYRQVIPVFFYGLLGGALFYLGAQAIPYVAAAPSFLTMTASGGVVAMAAAALTLAPRYRWYLAENFGIPLVVMAGIFVALNLVAFSAFPSLLLLCLGGAFAGWGMIRLLKAGYNPGGWMYALSSGIGNALSPDEARLRMRNNKRRQQTMQLTRRQREEEVTQRRVDEILDKIHQRGYHSLTTEEREMLVKASKEEAAD